MKRAVILVRDSLRRDLITPEHWRRSRARFSAISAASRSPRMRGGSCRRLMPSLITSS
jgi:hypothetical protein